MIDITFITSNQTKLAHARHLCLGYDVKILQYKKLFYGKGYDEPRIQDRKKLLEDSIRDAIERWKKNVSNFDNRIFFIEDTSVRIEALSNRNTEVPGVDIKYWMQEHDFSELDKVLKQNGNDRRAIVFSHVILFLTNDIKKKTGLTENYKLFSSNSSGAIVENEYIFETQILYPWLDNKTFNKWFVPNGFDKPISMLDIIDADKVDFRKGAFEQMLLFLQQNNEVHHIQQKVLIPRLSFKPLFIICGPTCAGKSTIGKLLLEKYGYYHIEASDFMALKYYETHGTKFNIDKNIFAAELLKVNPLVVADGTIDYIRSKSILDHFIVTGFRTQNEVSYFMNFFSAQDIVLLYISASIEIRYARWKNRQRDNIEYTYDKFLQINKLQEEMGLLKIEEMKTSISYLNESSDLSALYNDFSKRFMDIEFSPTEYNIDTSLLNKISLEKAILIVLGIKYEKNELIYFTTTEISHLINNTFKRLYKNKNNISRYFNQAYYIYYEIKKEKGKNKYKLSPTGYAEALFIVRDIQQKLRN